MTVDPPTPGPERSGLDPALDADQREVNSRLVSLTIEAQEQSERAGAARDRAEESVSELQTLAGFRELFVGIVGHDLRNPLGSIMLLADTLLEIGHLDDPDRAKVARIRTGCVRMARILDQLVDLTRARLGAGVPLARVPANLAEIAGRVVAEFDGAGVRLETSGSLDGVWDPDRLGQVLSNVVGNAIDHASPGTPVVIALRGADPEVVVEIRNQGEPIAVDVLPFIFEPFRQGRPGVRGKAGHLGLGLYITKQIVVGHGGTVDARSSDGTTVFTVRLPRSSPATVATY